MNRQSSGDNQAYLHIFVTTIPIKSQNSCALNHMVTGVNM
jgi:hypothetical protein